MAGASCALAALTTGSASGVGARQDMRHIHASDTVRDLALHPAFRGFGQLLLPWDDARGASTPLAQIASLLPYHTHVDPDTVVDALNRMIDDASAGRVLFYDFYTAADKASEPTREKTGLFFLRGQPGAPFALIAPGGGFAYVASLHEGFPYAVELNRAGYNAFVLKYRCGGGGVPAIRDMAAALDYIHRHAETLMVSRRHYSLWGSSAGARMAAVVGSQAMRRLTGDALTAPSAIVMAYTGHTDVDPTDPPTFALVGDGDTIALPSTMERRAAALRRQGTDVEFRKYRGVGHGFGLGVGTSAEGWMSEAIGFWARQNAKERR